MENQIDSKSYLNMDLLRFTTAGSVDDGKSTLIGRLMYDTKTIFEDQMEFIDEFTPKEITVLPPTEEENIEQPVVENPYVQDEGFPNTDLVESDTEAKIED